MEIELDIGLKPDRLKIPKKWIGGSIKGWGKKKEKKVRTKTKDFFSNQEPNISVFFRVFDPILSQVCFRILCRSVGAEGHEPS
jgi:hypothetical protein